MRNSQQIGKDFEKTLKSVFLSLQGSTTFLFHEFVDSHAAGNLVAGQPADYLVSINGKLAFLEAKASTTQKRFQRSMLQPAQRGAIIKHAQIMGTPYYILFHSSVEKVYHILDGAIAMKGSRINYADALLMEIPEQNCLALSLTGHWNLRPLSEAIRRYEKNYV